MLGFALVASACSGSDATSEPAPTTNAPPTTDVGGSDGSVPRSAEPAPATSTAAEATDAFLDQLGDQGFNGVVAVRSGSEVSTRAYGIADRENEVAVDAETVFDIGSVSKQFTAAAILRLEMDGVLSTEDTLGEHVPGLPDDKAAITLHQLLTNTGGLPHSLGLDDEPIGRSDFLALVGETPLIAVPGEEYNYSNVGFALLGAVIEFETGGSYETYLRTSLLEPAGMLDTGYVLPDWDGQTIAVGYTETGDRFGRPNEQIWDADGPYWHLRANGGLLSTAADMLRWDEALQSEDVLDANAKAKFFAPHVPDGPAEGVAYAYGWVVVPMPMGGQLITHNGGNGTFFADYLWFAEHDITIFVATNSYRPSHDDLASEVANRLFDGELAALTEDDPGGNCGFDDLSVLAVLDHPQIEALPESPSGDTVAALLDVLAEGDAAARLEFVNEHLAGSLSDEDPSTLAEDLAGLQEILAGYDVAKVLEEDDHRFHLLVEGPGGDLLLSVGFDETEPDRLACIAISD